MELHACYFKDLGAFSTDQRRASATAGKLEPGRLVSAIGLLIPQCRPGRTTKTPRLQGNLSRRSRSYGHSMGVNTPARKSALGLARVECVRFIALHDVGEVLSKGLTCEYFDSATPVSTRACRGPEHPGRCGGELCCRQAVDELIGGLTKVLIHRKPAGHSTAWTRQLHPLAGFSEAKAGGAV